MTDRRCSRRSLLRTGAVLGASLSVAGCLGVDPLGVRDGRKDAGAHEGVVLDEPVGYEDLRSARDEGFLNHPIHGDELPAVTAPCAFHDESISTTQFVGDRHVLMTFAYTRCPGVCLTLVASLAHVQVTAFEAGFEDAVAFLPVTFDPEYDTPDRLESYSEARGAVVGETDWHFLRPETPERVETVVNESFGVEAEYVTPARREERGLHPDMAFTHLAIILLANADGYVERAYVGDGIPTPGGLIEDVQTLRERW